MTFRSSRKSIIRTIDFVMKPYRSIDLFGNICCINCTKTPQTIVSAEFLYRKKYRKQLQKSHNKVIIKERIFNKICDNLITVQIPSTLHNLEGEALQFRQVCAFTAQTA